MTRVADAELATWPAGSAFDVQEAMRLLTMRIAGETLFGIDLVAHDDRDEFAASFRSIISWLTDRFYNPRSLPAFVPSRKNQAMRRARAALRSLVGRLIYAASDRTDL